MNFAPIWKDRTVLLSSYAAFGYTDFEIRMHYPTGELLYSGRSYRRPGDEGTFARINDICADRLAAPVFQSGRKDLNRYGEVLQAADTFLTLVDGEVVDTVTFVRDWSYNPDFDPSVMDFADPVTGEIENSMALLFTINTGAPSAQAVLTYLDGRTETVWVPCSTLTDFGNDFDGTWMFGTSQSVIGTAILRLAQYPGLASVRMGSTTYKVLQCSPARYAAYYRNAFGGWDSLLLEGTADRRDGLTHHVALRYYDNSNTSFRGLVDYAIEVVPSWTLRTGLLTDEQSARMHHLLNSPQIQLLDIAEGRFYPVSLTDTSSERLTRRGNGLAPIQYTFNAQLARERFRR